MLKYNEEMNDWIDILLAYNEGEFSRYYFGLTPRLIIGACQIPIGLKFENNKTAYEITKEIYKEMESYNKDGLIVTSNDCDINSGPVIKLVEAEWTVDSIGTSFDIIWNRYGNEIIEGEFGISPYDQGILNTIFDQKNKD